METKSLRIIIFIFMLWVLIFVGLGRISFNYYIWAVDDLKDLLIIFMDVNPTNYLILIIIDDTINTESNITSLYLNFAWFNVLIFSIIFNILIAYYSKRRKENKT